MATVTGLTADRMQEIINTTIQSGHVDTFGHLILVTYDSTEIDAGYVLAVLPDASETVKGKIELATTTEAAAGTDTVRAVTPAGVAAAVPDASETVKGRVELATTTEAAAGTDTLRAVTPAGLAAVVPSASTTDQGKVELATTAEATTGTDTVRAVTPAGVKAAIDAALQLIFPVGSIYTSTSVATSPATLLGFGTWASIQDHFLLGASSTYSAGSTGGEAAHTLTVAEMPAHTHTMKNYAGTVLAGAGAGTRFAASTAGASTAMAAGSDQSNSMGSGNPHNNMPPYLAVHMWQRIA